MAISNPGGNLNSVPASQKQTLDSNYIDFTSADTKGWAQQYLPDLMEAEAEVFGPRTISGFLAQVGAEESMTADQVIWSEQSRLHISVKGSLNTDVSIFTVQSDIDDNAGSAPDYVVGNHGVRLNDIVLVAVAGKVIRAHVTKVDGAAITAQPYSVQNFSDDAAIADADLSATLLVIGSEFKKGVTGQGSYTATGTGSPRTVKPTHKSFTNKPIIMKDVYEISGSDASQIGWVEISGEAGQSGYLWYLKAEGETRSRFTDYLEMTMMEAEKTAAASHIVDAGGTNDTDYVGLGTISGTEGLFAAIKDRGNITTGVTGVNAATDLAEFDAILAEFDSQGAIEENMLFLNRATSLAFDDMLASMNSYGAGGTSYGVFDNSEDMALNLGFSGFRRGSYDFYKSDFRYLNDKATRGSINERATSDAVRGVIIPAGVSTVYDQALGRNLKRPFLHVRFRASATDNRRMKTWTTGSVGAVTSDLDAMQIHYLSERCLVVQGANNFMLMK
tara:strand:+ start:18 stop:1526 length:1509 start_codon:yes stop_codon:yes gene_type:complete